MWGTANVHSSEISLFMFTHFHSLPSYIDYMLFTYIHIHLHSLHAVSSLTKCGERVFCSARNYYLSNQATTMIMSTTTMMMMTTTGDPAIHSFTIHKQEHRHRWRQQRGRWQAEKNIPSNCLSHCEFNRDTTLSSWLPPLLLPVLLLLLLSIHLDISRSNHLFTKSLLRISSTQQGRGNEM